MIILPFHKQWNGADDLSVQNVGSGWRGVNQRVLKNAPCSVAVLVDRGFGSIDLGTPGPDTSIVTQRVCVVFFGGPDDREALELGGRMTEHPAVRVTVLRFVNEKEGLEGEGFMLRPSPTKSVEVSYSFSTATMNREEEKVINSVYHILHCIIALYSSTLLIDSSNDFSEKGR